jgi:uncharacterized membrane protein YecN with MAPEG domain
MNPWTALTTLAALIFYLATSINVARSRHRHGLHAPAMSGHEVVERALRVQGNTLEWLVIFLPSLWLFSGYWGAYLGAALGLVWIFGRILYMGGYMQAAAKRGPGFGIQGLATLILLIGAVAGAIRALMAG